MLLLHKIIKWILSMINPQSTDRVTEDTAGLQRKIVYRGRIDVDTSGFTSYLQEDGASTYLVGSLSETIDELEVSNTLYSVDYALAFVNAPYNYQMFKGNYIDGGGPYTQSNVNVAISSNSGKLKITFNIKAGFTVNYIYYVVYSTRITEDTIL